MKIEIAKKLRPFMRVPGAMCLLPRGQWLAQLFPTRFCFTHLATGARMVWDPRPLSNMMVTQDLERGLLHVHGKEGSYTITHMDKGIEIRGTASALLTVDHELPIYAPKEHLFLGVHKAQDAELVRRRCDLTEIVPLWHRLGLWMPECTWEPVGTLSLVRICRELIETRQKEHLSSTLQRLFLAGFSSMLVPRIHDDQLQGIVPEVDPAVCSPLPLLTQGSSLLRSLIFQRQGAILHILPCLPPEWHSGRFITDEISIEWSKKCVQKVILRPKQDGEIFLALQKQIARFRLRRSIKDHGRVMPHGTPITCSAGAPLFLDRFEK